MLNRSKDADRILALPMVHHPMLSQMVHGFASNPFMTFSGALNELCREMDRRGLTQLDIEMVQPGADTRVKFMPSTGASGDSTEDRIGSHVRHLLGVER